MALRIAKLALLAGLVLFYALVVFGNLTDFHSNYTFVSHVLSMDTTFPGNHGMWRALPSTASHMVFYWMMIAWEFATTLMLAWAVWVLFAARNTVATEFNRAKRAAVYALTFSLLMWLVAFLDVGGEWFMMWQSRAWNGQEEATRMFVVVGLTLLLVAQPDKDEQP